MTATPAASETTPSPIGAASAAEAVLAGLEASRVTWLARRVLADRSASVATWAYERLRYSEIAAAAGGLFRVHGTARSGGATAPWSVVLKVTRRPAGATTSGGAVPPAGASEDPAHDQYWKREAEAYRSGLLGDLPGALAAPRCYDAVDQADGSIWLWLEAIDDEYGGRWPLSRYGLAARHLGRFNGASLTGRPLPSAPWLARDFLRQWVDRTTARGRWQILERDDVWAHPLVRRAFPTPIAARVQRLKRMIGPLLDAMDRLPQPLCHQDAFSRNLLSRRSPDGQLCAPHRNGTQRLRLD